MNVTCGQCGASVPDAEITYTPVGSYCSIFSANAAFEYSQEVRGDYGYTHTSRLGYLTEPMYTATDWPDTPGYAASRTRHGRVTWTPIRARFSDAAFGTWRHAGIELT